MSSFPDPATLHCTAGGGIDSEQQFFIFLAVLVSVSPHFIMAKYVYSQAQSPASQWVHTFPNSATNHGWVCLVRWGGSVLPPHIWQITHSYAALILGRGIMFLAADMMEGMSKPGLCDTAPSLLSSLSAAAFLWQQQEYLSQSQHRLRLKEA